MRRYRRRASSEPYLKVSPHTAQAFRKDTLVERPGCNNTALQPLRYALAAFRQKSMSAPACAEICFLILKRFNKLSRNWNTCRKSAHHSPEVYTRFSARSCFIPYPPHYRAAFAFSEFSMPSLHGPALRLACHAVFRMAD